MLFFMKELYKYTFSALNPILWLCGISTPLCLMGVYAFRNVHSISIALTITAIVPIAIACFAYIFLIILFFSFPKSFFQKLSSEDSLLHNNDAPKKPQNLTVNTNPQLGDKTLIEKSLSDAIDKLRDLNRIDLNELNLKYARPWQIASIAATVIITAFGLFSYFVAPEWIKHKIENFIRENVIGKQVIAIVKDETTKYVEEYLKPLTSKAEDLGEQLKIQQYVIDSRAGERDSYEELKKLAEKKPKLTDYIQKAIRDIEFHYDGIKFSPASPKLVGRYFSLAIEDIIDMYRRSDPNIDVREAAIGTLIDFYGSPLIKTNIVQELCEAIDSEKNLRVIARTTLLLYYLTRENFRPLEIDSVKGWWEKHKNEPRYKSPYKYYFKALRYIKRGTPTDTKKREVISLLDKTIDGDSNAIHARCVRGGFYSLIGEDGKAEKDFEYVKNYVNEFKQWVQKNVHQYFYLFKDYEYKWLFFWQAASLVKQCQTNDAVNSLKKALEIDPELKSDLKYYANKFEEFKTLKEHL